ncbi:hypothetical protein OCO53_25615 [Peribacillus frigoritolerans]|nr:hypothetical protein [Peribacillus frigoritolerans]MCU6603822.1 hypothetical protein [Peribacillus frigoritolerans]
MKFVLIAWAIMLFIGFFDNEESPKAKALKLTLLTIVLCVLYIFER